MAAIIGGRLCGFLLMLFGDVMNRSDSVRLAIVLYAGLVLLVVKHFTNENRRMEEAEVITDVELFLKAARLQDLILPEQQKVIDELANGWNNESYRGAVKRFSIAEWLSQTQIDISKR